MKATNPLLVLGFAAVLGTAGVFLHRGQVQQAVALEKIMALEARLTANNQQGAREMTRIVSAINSVVSKNRNQARDVAVLTTSQQILGRARSVIDTLRAFQHALRLAAPEAQTGALQHPAAARQSARITPRQLARQLDRYTTFIRHFVPATPALTHTIPGGTTWLYPEHAPVAAALASLTRLEAQVRRQATEALNLQAQKVGSPCGFEKIGAIAVPASHTVAPGATYEAQLFLTQAATGLRPVMHAEGKALAVQPDGRGAVTIQVPLQRPGQADTVRAQWQGTIQVQMGGNDTILRVTAPYLIVKPSAQ